MDIYRAKLEFPALRRRIEDRAREFWTSLILIEEAGSGVQLALSH